MSEPVCIGDAGPLVDFLVPESEHHEWVRQLVMRLPSPLLTCEPVLAEAAHLVRRKTGGIEALLELIESRSIEISFALQVESDAVSSLIRRYRDVPMSLADACLVRMAEIRGLPICTLDSHFTVYRKHGRDPLAVISPAR